MGNSFRDKVSLLTGVGGPAVSMSGLLDERDAIKPESAARYLELPSERFVPDPNQPRRSFDADELSAFQAGLERDGQLQPIVVTAGEDGQYNIIAGERRWRAISQSTRLNTVQAVLIDGPVDDEQRLLLQIVENRDREDISVFDEAMAVKRFVDIGEAKGRRRSECAERLRVNASLLSKYMAIAEAGDTVASLAKSRENQDIEALYLLSKVSERDSEAAASLAEQFREGNLDTSLRVASRRLLDDTPKQPYSGGSSSGSKKASGSPAKPKKKGPAIPRAKGIEVLAEEGSETYLLKVSLSERRSVRYRLDRQAISTLVDALSEQMTQETQ